jgi:hypothetical protein
MVSVILVLGTRYRGVLPEARRRARWADRGSRLEPAVSRAEHGDCRGGEATLDQFDLLSAIVDWVEKGHAPDALNDRLPSGTLALGSVGILSGRSDRGRCVSTRRAHANLESSRPRLDATQQLLQFADFVGVAWPAS